MRLHLLQKPFFDHSIAVFFPSDGPSPMDLIYCNTRMRCLQVSLWYLVPFLAPEIEIAELYFEKREIWDSQRKWNWISPCLLVVKSWDRQQLQRVGGGVDGGGGILAIQTSQQPSQQTKKAWVLTIQPVLRRKFSKQSFNYQKACGLGPAGAWRPAAK